jgi:predicted Zn finger-like uncharacterized protein
MSEQIRYNVAMDTAREILEQAGLAAGSDYALRLGKIAFAVLEAIYRAENELAVYDCRFVCPKCYRHYKVNVELRGRAVKCVGCGHRWRAPEAVSRN